MKNKPLIFTFLSSLCLIEPLIKVLYFKAITHFDFVVILSNIIARNSFKDVFDFWLVYPIAGVLLIRLRKWSYFTFMGILIYIIYNLFTYEKYTWPFNSETPFLYHYVVAIISLLVFIVFLHPGVREPFFNRRVRWWEPDRRYGVEINCSLKGEKLIFASEILNISKSGAFLKDSAYFKEGEKLELEFTYMGNLIILPIEVIHKHTIRGRDGYGVKFNFLTFRQSLLVSKIIKMIKETHLEV